LQVPNVILLSTPFGEGIAFSPVLIGETTFLWKNPQSLHPMNFRKNAKHTSSPTVSLLVD
jgi:hypothetical protein